MAERLYIGNDHGEKTYNFEFSFTLDGDVWHTVLFEALDDARDYADEVLAENEENHRFLCNARRIVTVSTCDFFDRSLSAVEIRVVSRHSERGL